MEENATVAEEATEISESLEASEADDKDLGDGVIAVSHE